MTGARTIIGIGSMLLLVLLARAFWMPHALFGDERFSMYAVSGDLRQAVVRTTDDVHPPLHSVLLWLWREVGIATGAIERAAATTDPYPAPDRDVLLWYRWMNVFLFLPGAWLAWAIAREAAPRRPGVGFVVLGLLAVLPFGCYWDTTARPYPLLNLLLYAGLLALLVDARGRLHPLWLAGAGAVLVAACFTHYFAYAYVGFYGLVGLCFHGWRRAALRSMVTAWGALAVVVVANLVLFPSVGRQLLWNLGRGEGEAGRPVSIEGLLRGLTQTLASPGQFLVETAPGRGLGLDQGAWLWGLLLVAAVLGLCAAIAGLVREYAGVVRGYADFRRSAGAMLLVAFGPMLVLDLFVCGRDVMPRMLRHYNPSYLPWLIVLVLGWTHLVDSLRAYWQSRPSSL